MALSSSRRPLADEVGGGPQRSLAVIGLARQFSSYVGVGVMAAGLHYTVLVALVELAGVHPVLAALIGYSTGGILSYVLNRQHTFGSERPHGEAIWRFVLVASAGFGLTYISMYTFVDVLHHPYLAAQLVTTGMTLIWNFTANRLWTFRFEE